MVADRRIQAGQSVQSAFEIPVGDAKGTVKIEAQLLYRKVRPETIQAYNLPDDVYGAERRVAQAILSVQNP